MTEEKKSDAENFELGNLVSVPFGNSYLQGTVKSIEAEHLLIENYAAGKVKVPKNDLVYKFFPGQKFDIRELNLIDENSDKKLTTKQKLDGILSKTEVKTFDNLVKNHPKQVGQLLAGKLTSKLYNGSSLVQKEGEDFKTKLDWSAKFQLFRGKDKNLKLDVKFKKENINLKIYGKDLTPDEQKAVLKEGKTITLDRTSKAKKDYKVFAKFDKDLNTIVTSPYSKRVAERIAKSVAKKEDLSPKTKQAPAKSAAASTKQAPAKSATVKKAPAKKTTGKKL